MSWYCYSLCTGGRMLVSMLMLMLMDGTDIFVRCSDPRTNTKVARLKKLNSTCSTQNIRLIAIAQ
jgi:hypothetical protein